MAFAWFARAQSARGSEEALRASSSQGAREPSRLARPSLETGPLASGSVPLLGERASEIAHSAPHVSRFLSLAPVRSEVEKEEEWEADFVPLAEFLELPRRGDDRLGEADGWVASEVSRFESGAFYALPAAPHQAEREESDASDASRAESKEQVMDEEPFSTNAAEKGDLGWLGVLLFACGAVPRPTLCGSVLLSRAYSAIVISVVISNFIFRFVRAILSKDDSAPFFFFALLTWVMKLRLAYGVPCRGGENSASIFIRVLKLRWNLGWYLHPLIHRRTHINGMKNHQQNCRSYFKRLFWNVGRIYFVVFCILVILPLPARIDGIWKDKESTWSSEWDEGPARHMSWRAVNALILASDFILAAAASASIVVMFTTVEVLRSHLGIIHRNLMERELEVRNTGSVGGDDANDLVSATSAEEPEFLSERERRRLLEMRKAAMRATVQLAESANVIVFLIVGSWSLISLATLVMYALQFATHTPPSKNFTTLSAMVAAILSLVTAIQLDRWHYKNETMRILNHSTWPARRQSIGVPHAKREPEEKEDEEEEKLESDAFVSHGERQSKQGSVKGHGPLVREVVNFCAHILAKSMPAFVLWAPYLVILIQFFFVKCEQKISGSDRVVYINCSRSELRGLAFSLALGVLVTNLASVCAICIAAIPETEQRAAIGRRLVTFSSIIFVPCALAIIWLVLSGEGYSETRSFYVKLMIAAVIFSQVVFYIFVVRQALRNGDLGVHHSGDAAVESINVSMSAAAPVSTGMDQSKLTTFLRSFFAWALNCFVFYFVTVFLLLPIVRQSTSGAGAFVFASRLFGHISLTIAEALLERIVPIIPRESLVKFLLVSRFLVNFASRVMIPNVTSANHQAYLVLWITGLEIALRMLRPAIAAMGDSIRELLQRCADGGNAASADMGAAVGGSRRSSSALSAMLRAELDAHRVLTLMVAKNLSIVAALIISVFFRALNGIDVFSRALVPIFAMQLVLSCVSDVLCVFMEIRYLRLDLVGVAEAYYLDWRAILAPCLVAIFLGGNILSPLYLQVFDLQNSG